MFSIFDNYSYIIANGRSLEIWPWEGSSSIFDIQQQIFDENNIENDMLD